MKTYCLFTLLHLCPYYRSTTLLQDVVIKENELVYENNAIACLQWKASYCARFPMEVYIKIIRIKKAYLHNIRIFSTKIKN